MPGWKFEPYSLGGTQINDGATYMAYHEFGDQPMRLIARDPVELDIPGDYAFPQVARQQPGSGIIRVHVEIKALLQANLVALLRVFDRMKGDTAYRVKDEAGTEWECTVRIRSLRAVGPNRFVAELYAPRPVFEKATQSSDAETVNASGTTWQLSPTVEGTTRTYPEIEIKGTVNKSAANDYTRRWQVHLAWRSELPGEDSVGNGYPVDVADGVLDTATEVGAGRMQADGDDLRVLVDGVEFPRKLSGINTANTKVWVPIHFSPRKQVLMTVAASGASPATGATWSVQDGQTLRGWPERGKFLIDTECVWYSSRTDTAFQNIIRGFGNTTAAAHSAGAAADWVEHDIQIISNYSGATAPTEPTLAISHSASTNLAHTYNGLFTALHLSTAAAGQMRPRYTVDNVKAAGLSLADSTGLLLLADHAPGGAYWPYNNAELYVPCGVKVAAGALAYDVSGGVLGSGLAGSDIVLDLRVFGVDIATGVERLLATYRKADRTGAKTLTPDVVLQRVRLNAIYTAITGAGGTSWIDIGIGAAGKVGGDSKAERFNIDQDCICHTTGLVLRENAGADTKTVEVVFGRVEGSWADPDDSLEVFNYTVPNASLATSYAWVTASGASFAIAAGEYTILAAGSVAGAGTLYIGENSSINARGANWSESGGTWSGPGRARDFGFLIIGDGSSVQADAPSGLEGYATLDNLVVTLDNTTPRTPKIVRAAQETIYMHRGVLRHTNTGQEITLFWPALINETITIDCDNKRVVLDAATNRYAPGSVTFGDPEQWMHLQGTGVAANNTLQYTETNMGTVVITTRWYDWWG